MPPDLSECLERHESLQYNNEFCTPPEVALALAGSCGGGWLHTPKGHWTAELGNQCFHYGQAMLRLCARIMNIFGSLAP